MKKKINNFKLYNAYENMNVIKSGVMTGNLTGYSSIDKPWLKKEKYRIYMPDDELTAYNFLYECNKNHLNDVALVYDPIIDVASNNITYKKLFEDIDACAKAYIALGVKKGDIVTVSLPSFVENIVSFYALNKIGVISNQIHPLASQDEIEFYLEEAKSKIFLGYGDVYDKIKNINHKLEHIILVSPTNYINKMNKLRIIKNKFKDEGIAGVRELIKSVSKESDLIIEYKDFIKLGSKIKNLDDYVNHDSSTLAVLTHTSGTTGKSKGVMTDSKSLNKSVTAILQETKLFQRYDKELLVLPPFPLYVLNNVVHLSLCVGEQLIVVPQVDYANLSKYFYKHHPQHVKGIPSVVDAIMKDKGFDNYDFSDFKFLISGGGKFTKDKEGKKFLSEHNCKYGVANGYGMSELGGCVTCMFDSTIELGTVGRPLVNSNAKAVDLETGEEIKYTEDKNGEIWLSSPSAMLGYYQNKEATDSMFVKGKDGNIWVKTGDLGRITEEGNIKLVGRIKRMTFIFDSINNNASKVSHDYVESTLCENENVEDCIVVAVKDLESQHALKAYVTVKESPYDKVIGELDQLCKVRFRKYVSPVEYVIVDNIPKTAAGKNDYRYIEEVENGKNDKSKIKILYRKQISER